jgi:hypothetical protein
MPMGSTFDSQRRFTTDVAADAAAVKTKVTISDVSWPESEVEERMHGIFPC